ncbi:MAG: protein-L-isoaspartate(D-aspartate) O-methyltransferase [Candidatus Schekmanbacteria bacterium]|nr:MAG: protein-L-isoaspartate(D-aspartate) O-methyltransferase [Candidatus Schekmanbacteria bacterium]
MNDYLALREKMIEEQLVERGITDVKVLFAMRKVPRHLFVPKSIEYKAYTDSALPIGEGQTISQPYIVALMTQSLLLQGEEKVLEIGTGSGYQTAILAEIASEVYSIERIGALTTRARKILDELGYTNISTRTFDGTYGWKDKAPFDAIIITAAAPSVPENLLKQLKDGGRLVAPIGTESSQDLVRIIKRGDELIEEKICSCLFVKLIGKYGWSNG